ncbi:uncharacterized protein TNCV_1998421 [Trichonephila clavipes]|nr:uncharacterized protein TNCV_1998421 [Trichonephila clavipes]
MALSTALSMEQFLTSKNITVVEHPPYSHYLAPCDLFFFLFPTVKSCLMGTHFASVAEVQVKTKNFLKSLPKTSFQNCYHQGQHRMQNSMNAEGDYFEGQNVTEN